MVIYKQIDPQKPRISAKFYDLNKQPKESPFCNRLLQNIGSNSSRYEQHEVANSTLIHFRDIWDNQSVLHIKESESWKLAFKGDAEHRANDGNAKKIQEYIRCSKSNSKSLQLFSKCPIFCL